MQRDIHRYFSSSDAMPIQPVSTNRKFVCTIGRPPWYDETGNKINSTFVIGICGGSGSGKTTVAKKIVERLNISWVSLLSMDSFYKTPPENQLNLVHENNYNFDHPDSMDFALIVTILNRLRLGKNVNVPIYDFCTHRRTEKTKIIYGANIVIFEGIMAFDERILPLLDLKIFVDVDADERLDRRLRRDIVERGRSFESVLTAYERFVKPAYDSFVTPMMKMADIIIPRGGENNVALDFISNLINRELDTRGLKNRSKLTNQNINMDNWPPKNLHILPATNDVKALHTIIRDKNTSRNELMFNSDRLMRLTFEFAATFLPYKDFEIKSCDGSKYMGKNLDLKSLCAVSILRAGETMENAVLSVFKDVVIGKILIQTNERTLEPELHYLRLPDCIKKNLNENHNPLESSDISNTYVLLMDSTVASGAAAMMAIQVLLDHDIPEQNIMLVGLIMSQQGVNNLSSIFPKVQIVTAAVDNKLTEDFRVLPGIGNFGDRYFGTEA